MSDQPRRPPDRTMVLTMLDIEKLPPGTEQEKLLWTIGEDNYEYATTIASIGSNTLRLDIWDRP